jgi:hypothetical protein
MDTLAKIIEYTNESNIVRIHNSILEHYTNLQKTKLKEWIKERDRLIKERDSTDIPVIRKGIESKIEVINSLEDILSPDKGNKFIVAYQEAVDPILDEYNKLMKSVRRVFGKPPMITDEQIRKRSELIHKFANVVKEHTNIIMVEKTDEQPNSFNRCPECGNTRDLINDVTLVCKDCGISDINITKDSYQGGNRKTVMVSKNEYSSRDNFIKELEKMQAKQKNVLPHDIIERLDTYFKSYNLLTSDEIKKKPKVGRRRGPYKKSDLRKALSSDIELRRYYKHIDLIAKLYWGWDPIILTDEQYTQLMANYDDAQAILHKINKGVRKSCISVEYSKFRHLKLIGVECCKDDFNIVSTEEILNNYEKMWKEVCRQKGWEFVPITSYS